MIEEMLDAALYSLRIAMLTTIQRACTINSNGDQIRLESRNGEQCVIILKNRPQEDWIMCENLRDAFDYAVENGLAEVES